jgi:hypothetical protein
MENSSKSAALIVCMAGVALMLPAAESQTLPWEREIPLREAVQSVTLESKLNPTDPNSRSTMCINNLKMHTVLWEPPNQITITEWPGQGLISRY